MIILGIDPGSRKTGFGLIENQPNRITYIHSGYLNIKGDTLAEKLGQIFVDITELISEYQPKQMGIEQVFMHRNADSALKLGQARGAAICAGHIAGLEIGEYAPRLIKQAVVGTGAASKEQVLHMVQRLLSLNKDLQSDESDGLAIAICHAQYYATQQKTGIDPKLLKNRRTNRR
jgi:crossover junction endodeoxyribonuclease RuvC